MAHYDRSGREKTDAADLTLTMKSPAPPAIAQLSAGESVLVTKRVDVKHYLIYKVRLPDGRDGFVLDGEYTLMRDGKEAF